MSTMNLPRNLGNDLVLRTAVPADRESLIAFNSKIHAEISEQENSETIGAWTHDLLNGKHPTVSVKDFTVVEHKPGHKIVSSVCLISQTWAYGGIPFAVGRPELVGTDPAFRKRGLVRTQFDVIHKWSRERGQSMQVITGIPYYYRQFGYEMCLSMHEGRGGYLSDIPPVKGEETCRIRPAANADIPFIRSLYRQSEERSLVSCTRNDAQWRYELAGKSRQNITRMEFRIIETKAGEPVGFFAHPFELWRSRLVIQACEIRQNTSWLPGLQAVLQYIKTAGKALAENTPGRSFHSFAFLLGEEHPVYDVIPDYLPVKRHPYAWYVRIDDIPAFLRLITPVLEQRLASSPLAKHTGKLKYSFYRDGAELIFELGKIKSIAPYSPTRSEDGDALFTMPTFLQLLLGYRSLEELEYAYADCYACNNRGKALTQVLFPKKPSCILALA